MPSAQVSSYTAHIGRLGPLGSDRLLVLSHVTLDEGRVAATSEIYFSDRFADSEIGFSTLGHTTNVQAHLPADDYALWVDLLRHEAPMYLHWTLAEQADQPEADGIIHLATGPEPPGEGPVDYSH